MRERFLNALTSILEFVENVVSVMDSQPSPPSVPSRVVVPAKRSHAEMEEGAVRVVQRTHFNPRHGFSAQGPRKSFDFNRLGGEKLALFFEWVCFGSCFDKLCEKWYSVLIVGHGCHAHEVCYQCVTETHKM